MENEAPQYLLDVKKLAWDLQSKIRNIPEMEKELLKTAAFWKCDRKHLIKHCFGLIIAVNKISADIKSGSCGKTELEI